MRVIMNIQGTSPSYLQSCLTHVADMTSRRQLRSYALHSLEVPPVRLSTVYSRQAGVAGFWSTVWNELPLHVASAPSLAVLRQQLLRPYSRSYLGTIIWLTHVLMLPFMTTVWTPVVLAIINII